MTVEGKAVLTNGIGQIEDLEFRPGRSGERNYVGKVLARLEHNDLHPYVVWGAASDDGVRWDCFSGDYQETLDGAREAFGQRRF